MPSTAPAAVLFDLDGTLVDSEPLNVESVVIACRRWGVDLDKQDQAFVVGHSWNEIHHRLQKKYGLGAPMGEVIAAAVEEKDVLLERHGLPVLPHAVETVVRLAARSKLAVVSGASRVEVKDAVGRLGLTSFFQFLLGAEDYQQGKPHPEPYRLAMERLAVAPERCLVIEDAAPGIASARAAGARVIAVRAGSPPDHDLSGAHAIVETLAEVTDALCDALCALTELPPGFQAKGDNSR